jgi:long-subunit acyl-CoA synthetase (AMP-forming)
MGCVGKIYPEVEFKLSDDGEICVRSNYHFFGYYKNPELTAEVLDDEGWLHTGDIGSVDKDGYLAITDRKRNIFKSSNGKYVVPQKVEDLLKAHPHIHEAVVIGENHAHCVALATIDAGASNEASFSNFLKQVNSQLASHEQIRALGCLDRPWTPTTGELTPTLKVKRKNIMEKYKAEISALYAGSHRVQFFHSTSSESSDKREGRAC